jgi:hypothetical protein
MIEKNLKVNNPVSYTDKSTLHFGIGTLVPLYLFHGDGTLN